MTSWSLNCSRMSSQIGVGGSSAMAAMRSVWLGLLRGWSGREHTIAAVLVPQSDDLGIGQTGVLVDLEVGENAVGGMGESVVHGAG